MRPLKVLIADDSLVYRSQVKAALSAYSWIEIAGVAPNGKLALERLCQVTSDLLILDLEMPELDGLGVLRELAATQLKVKTILFSASSRRGAEITFEALKLGAADFVAKPGSDGPALAGTTEDPSARIRSVLEPKLRALFPERFEAEKPAAMPTTALPPSQVLERRNIVWELLHPKVIVIGSSTGGPTALETLFQALKRPIPVPILVAQHMPPVFTAGLAERITKLTGIPATEAKDGEPLQGGHIYIAPGDYHMTVQGLAASPRLKLDQSAPVNSVRPAVDPLFASAAQVFGDKCIGIVLTGMGHDGRDGAIALKDVGAPIVVQDRASSVVYGMPGAVLDAGVVDRVAKVPEIAALLNLVFSHTSVVSDSIRGDRKYA